MDKKIIQFHVCIDGCHIPMKMMPGSTGYDFWPSCDITLRTKTITRVATGVKVIIPMSYVGVIHSKSGLAMEGIIAMTGVIDFLKENPVVQMVVYHTDKLPTTYHASDCVLLWANLQVKRGDRGFGEATKFFQAQLTDDLSDIEIPCSGAHVNELWQTPPKHNRSSHLVQSPMSITTELPTTTPSAPQKNKPEITPKPVMGIATSKRGDKVHDSALSTRPVRSVTKVLFKNTEDLSTDSNNVYFCESPDMSPLSVCDDLNGGLVARVNITHKMEKCSKIADAVNMHRVTCAVFKQAQRLHQYIKDYKIGICRG